MKCSVAIVGGGLGGLATAQALARFGISSDVFETAPALGEIGAAAVPALMAARDNTVDALPSRAALPKREPREVRV